MERINVIYPGRAILDLKRCSDVVAGIKDIKLTWAYFDRNLPGLETEIRAIVEEQIKTSRQI